MRVWVLNLDADLELECVGPYQPRGQVARALKQVLPKARALLSPDDWLLEEGQPLPARFVGLPGRCWCPTPSALQRLAQAGALPEPAPSLSVLRRVNDRRFCLELGGGAPESFFVNDELTLSVLLSRCRRDAWLCKTPHGFAGRGQRRIVGQPTPDDRRWLGGALSRGGFVAEPWLDIEQELCLHGLLEPSGAITLGRPCLQTTDAHRNWERTVLASPEAARAHGEALEQSARDVARALSAAGYFGPFGIDAYLHRTRAGVRLNSLGEINARFTMGFPVGLGRGSWS